MVPVAITQSAGQKNDANLLNKTELEQAAKKVNDTLSAFNIQERFVIGDKSGDVVVYLINTAKHEIICRIPPERVLNAARQLKEYIGMFLNEWI
ncbi:flagellar protein FlaG [Desulfotomaculum copahuensis]|nr:flagellar protein FlaG [Desulfotomaculum copahuensis]